MTETTPIALLQDDQRQRWHRGDRIPVETYLDQRPALQADPESLLDLIYNEMMLREEAGESPRFAEYCARFPHLTEQIRLLFEVHEVLEVEQMGKTNPVAGKSTDAAALHPAAGPPFIPVQVSGYEILGELGRGGMGVVYRARQLGLNRLVALKMILAGSHASPRQLARFRTEAEAVARLHHPNIVQIYEIEEQEGRPCFSLELVEGGSFEDRLSRAPQPPPRAAELVQTLARAMHYAHQRGIIHRDLKPSNVLLTADGTPKITDFGLAKLLDSAAGQTPTEAFLGTPNYMAPEQALGQTKEVGLLADVYALGAILYELLTGRPPFQGTTVLETLEQVRFQEPVPPRRLQPKVPRDLETICLKCLDKEGHRRYASAEALAEDLRRFLAGEPITGRPASLWRHAVKWTRRRPAAATLLAVAAASLLALVSAVAWSSIREGRRLTSLRAEVQGAARAGQRAFAAQNWPEARYQLAGALTRIGAEEALADLRIPLEEMHAEAGRRSSEQEARDHAAKVYRAFLQLRDNALFHGMDCLAPGNFFLGMDRAANRKAAAEAARAALARVGLEIERDTPWDLGDRFTEAQTAEIGAGVSAVLLVLADVTAHQAPSARPSQDCFRKALRILDRARQVGAPARACSLRRASYLEQLGEQEAARRERRRAATVPAASDLDRLLSGQEHYRGNRLPQAIKEFKKVLAAQPQHFWGRCFLAFCDLRLQNWERAWDNLTVCLSQRPDFVWARLLRGYAHREAGAYEEAALDFSEAERGLARHPNPEASYYLLLNRGLLFLRQGKLTAAAADLQGAIRLRPERYAAHLDLARVYQRQETQTLAGAAACAVALLGSPPGAPRPLLAVSILPSGATGKQSEVAALFRQVVRLQPPPLVLADYHAERGRDLYRAGRYQEAVDACRLALDQQADYPFALGVLAQALLELQRFADAARTFDRYLAEEGRPVADVYRGRGQARVQLGDYLGAVEDYTRVLERQPRAEIHTHRGWAYFFADAWRPALRDFEKALALDPTYGDAYTGRGLTRVMLGQYREAVEDAEQARRRKVASPEMMHNVACIFAQAAGKVVADPMAKEGQALGRRYRTAAVTAVRDTLTLLRAGERAQFWRMKILPDSALDPIRASPEFRQLVREQDALP